MSHGHTAAKQPIPPLVTGVHEYKGVDVFPAAYSRSAANPASRLIARGAESSDRMQIPISKVPTLVPVL